MGYLSSYTNFFSVSGGATRAGLGGARAQEHLEKALAEVDGLSAAFVYLDATESTGVSANRPRDDLAQELQALCATASFNEATDSQLYAVHNDARAREIAWSSIRTVRDGMSALWDHFVDFAANLDNPAINNILADYQDAKGLRQTGAIAFRNTVTGLVPNDLCKVFAFCSLSYVVSCLLYSRNRIAKGDILAGIRLWLDALEKEDEREAFKLLAEHLWPEARNHLHFMEFGLGEQSQRQATSLRRGGTPSSILPTYTQLASPSFTNPYLDHQPLSRCNFQSDVHYSEDDTPVHPTSHTQSEGVDPSLLTLQEARDSLSMYAQYLTQLTHDSCDFSLGSSGPPESFPTISPTHWQDLDPGPSYPINFEMSLTEDNEFAVPWAPAQSPAMYDSQRELLSSQTHILSSSTTAAESDAIRQLQDTSVFRAVVRFIHENACFWHDLAGGGLASKDFRSCLAWCQERLPQKTQLQASFIQPLSSQKNEHDLVSRGIVAIAEAFFERGLLQYREDIEFYMERAGKLLFDDRTAYREFRDWVHGFHASPSPSVSTTQKSAPKFVTLHLIPYLQVFADQLLESSSRAMNATTLPIENSI
ncbi:uncharacterized protein FIESC28_04783 [Fusarium coffeatum]|uniref:Uncharacterized protein n=1 Tax=Fusarium coffeatum TaxID=231269 RepID=A0A366RX74_9HYPO|nr:uncharacterized protein FIESC28_04783 [Fusarium coffeatum]RBR21683.1 hypothetical protein FIESC28_04783 [Fusarium coffeatum]